MQHKQIRNKEIRENICLLLYTQSFEMEKISPIFYSDRNNRVNEYIHQLKKEGWVKIKLGDYDARKKICYTKTKCFIDFIKAALKQNNLYLNDIEVQRLKKYLKSEGFKEWYYEMFYNLFVNEERKETYPINGFQTFLEMLSYRFIIYEQYAKSGIRKKKLLEMINKIRKEKLPPDFKEKKLLHEYDILGLTFLRKLKYIIPKVKVGFYEGMIERLVDVIKESNK